MEVQVLVAGVRHPVQVAEDPVREAKVPATEQDRADHNQREIGEDRDRECEGDMVSHTELPADLDLAQRPR